MTCSVKTVKLLPEYKERLGLVFTCDGGKVQ